MISAGLRAPSAAGRAGRWSSRRRGPAQPADGDRGRWAATSCRHRLLGRRVVASSCGCPVRCRNTSSRVGRRSAMSSAAMPASSSARTTSVRAATRSRTGALTRRASRSTSASAPATRATSVGGGGQLGRAAQDDVDPVAAERGLELRRACPRRSPGRRRSPTIRSASWSASSRYCVVSSTVVPPATSAAHRRPTPRCGCAGRARWSARPGTAPAGARIRLAARSSRRRMPPEYCLAGLSAASVSPNCSSSSSARRRARAAPRW